MSQILSIIAGALKLFGALADLFRDAKQRKAGEDAEARRTLEDTVDKANKRAETSDEVAKLSDAERRKRLNDWVRPK